MYEPVESPLKLHHAPSGSTLRVAPMAFETTRVICDDLGLREGEELHCIGATAEWVLCWTGNARSVLVPRGFARYIPVERAD